MLERLRAFDLLADFDDDRLLEISKNLTPISYVNGDLILLESEPSEHMYLVESGIIKVFKTSYEGKEFILYFVTPGDTLSEAPFKLGEANLYSAQALGPARVFRLSKEEFRKIAFNEKNLALRVVNRICEQFRKVLDLLGDLAFKKVSMRVAKIILEQISGKEDLSSPRRISQQEMASMAGTAREVVSRTLRDLDDRGLIMIKRHRIIIRDRKRLEEMAGMGL
jgi:CRP/FNR family transcriptional regulator, cyclic AMP receptor protein